MKRAATDELEKHKSELSEAIDMAIDLMVQEKILERDGPLTGATA
jgi:hypothetical protein